MKTSTRCVEDGWGKVYWFKSATRKGDRTLKYDQPKKTPKPAPAPVEKSQFAGRRQPKHATLAECPKCGRRFFYEREDCDFTGPDIVIALCKKHQTVSSDAASLSSR